MIEFESSYPQQYSETIKFRTETNKHALYFTIVGNPPEAFFLNSLKMEYFELITALMVSYSKQIKDGRPLEKVLEDMKKAFDPKGSYFIQDGTGRRVNGMIHHLALIIEDYIERNQKQS